MTSPTQYPPNTPTIPTVRPNLPDAGARGTSLPLDHVDAKAYDQQPSTSTMIPLHHGGGSAHLISLDQYSNGFILPPPDHHHHRAPTFYLMGQPSHQFHDPAAAAAAAMMSGPQLDPKGSSSGFTISKLLKTETET